MASEREQALREFDAAIFNLKWSASYAEVRRYGDIADSRTEHLRNARANKAWATLVALDAHHGIHFLELHVLPPKPLNPNWDGRYDLKPDEIWPYGEGLN